MSEAISRTSQTLMLEPGASLPPVYLSCLPLFSDSSFCRFCSAISSSEKSSSAGSVCPQYRHLPAFRLRIARRHAGHLYFGSGRSIAPPCNTVFIRAAPMPGITRRRDASSGCGGYLQSTCRAASRPDVNSERSFVTIQSQSSSYRSASSHRKSLISIF